MEGILPAGGQLPAMCSTQTGADKFRNCIPRRALLDALGTRAVVARSDLADECPMPFSHTVGEEWIDLEVDH